MWTGCPWVSTACLSLPVHGFFAGKHGLFVFTYTLHVWLHVGFNAAIFSSEGRTGFVSLSLRKCQCAMIRSVKCPQIRQSDEQLQIPASENVQRDNQRALVQRKTADPNHRLPHTEVGGGRGGTLGQGKIWKPTWSPRQIKVGQKVNSYLNLMSFFNLSM